MSEFVVPSPKFYRVIFLNKQPNHNSILTIYFNEEELFMLTRGKLLGEILDSLGQLSFVLQTRAKLGLFDLNRHCENFARDLLNLLYKYELVNLNDVRSNEPGLDLGDSNRKIGIQVTTDKRSTKINHTLEKITTQQKQTYNKFLILILGIKQGSYDGINQELANSVNFTHEDILDFNDIEQKIVSLPVEEINKVYDFLSKELIRVYSELGADETPSGESTSILSHVETKPMFSYSNCRAFVKHINTKHDVTLDEQQHDKAIRNLFKSMMELPKITREFFYALVSRAEFSKKHDMYVVRDEVMKRVIQIPDRRYYEELQLLEDFDLVQYSDEERYINYIKFAGLCHEEQCLSNILEFTNDNNIDSKKVFIDLDFSVFGEEG